MTLFERSETGRAVVFFGAIGPAVPSAWTRAWCWLARRTGPFDHCLIGDGSAVAVLADHRVSFCADAVARRCITIRSVLSVPTPRPFSLEHLDGLPPWSARRAAVHRVVRVLTLGWFQSPTCCVSVASDALRRAGVPVPKSILTPSDLRSWLIEHAHSRPS